MSKNTPKTSVPSLLKKELGKNKLATINEDKSRNMAGDITIEKIKKIAAEKRFHGSLNSAVKQVLGTCVSCGVTVEGRNPKDVIKEIDEGKIKIE